MTKAQARYTEGMSDTIGPRTPTYGRLTRHRQAVYDVIAAKADHLTAAQVYDAVRRAQPRIAYGTVYNALHYLVDAGLVAELLRHDGVVSYDRETSPHDHAVCRVCGALADIHLASAREQVTDSYAAVARQTGFAIEQHRVEYVGLCPTCRDADSRQSLS